MSQLLEKLSALVLEARNRYVRLVLLVGHQGSGKTDLLTRFAAGVPATTISIGSTLASQLIGQPVRRRSVAANDAFGDLVRATRHDLVLIDNIEVLFLPQLHLDPLKLLQDCARNRTVVACWPGALADQGLIYGSGGHPESRTYHSPDALLLAF